MPNTKTSDETAAGTLTGAELVRIVQGGNNRRATAQAIADLGGGGGLFAGALSAVPTSANTGLSTWLNQGAATVSDTAVGIVIDCPSSAVHNIRGRTKAAPATPYTMTALVAVDGYPANWAYAGIGWTDGTKLHTIALQRNLTVCGLEVAKWTNATTFSATDATVFSPVPPLQWMQIEDDGTTVFFRFSHSGVRFATYFSVAKASGHLGATGYTNLVFFGNTQNSNASAATLMSYAEG